MKIARNLEETGKGVEWMWTRNKKIALVTIVSLLAVGLIAGVAFAAVAGNKAKPAAGTTTQSSSNAVRTVYGAAVQRTSEPVEGTAVQGESTANDRECGNCEGDCDSGTCDSDCESGNCGPNSGACDCGNH